MGATAAVGRGDLDLLSRKLPEFASVAPELREMLIEEGQVDKADFPFGTDGFRPPVPAADMIDGIPTRGRIDGEDARTVTIHADDLFDFPL